MILRALFLSVFMAGTLLAQVPGVGTVVPEDSDPFTLMPDARWTGLLRGLPDALTPTDDGLLFQTNEPQTDLYTNACDFGFYFTREIPLSERPSIVMNLWVVPFEDWPTGPAGSVIEAEGSLRYNYFGLRSIGASVSATDPTNYLGFVYPSLFIAWKPDTMEYYFTARNPGDEYVKPISQAGWWTLGISFNPLNGSPRFYAAPGKVVLQESDFMIELDVTEPGYVMRGLAGNLLSLRTERSQTEGLSTPWRVLNYRVFHIAPNTRAPRPPAPRGNSPNP